MIIHWTANTDIDQCSGKIQAGIGATHIHANLMGVMKSAKAVVDIDVKDSETVFMNGFQTWTHCPLYKKKDKIRGVHGIPRAVIDKYSLDRYGDYHFVDYPNQRGILHGFSYCWFKQGEFYRLFASLDEKPGYTMFCYDASQAVLAIERDCAGVKCNGEYPLLDLFYAEGSEDHVFDAWFEALGVKPRATQKLFGYSSWYNRYQNISEETILADLEGCSRIFEKGDLFQVDDGWEPYVGDWLACDEKKFPHGMKNVCDQIHAAGYKAGLWLAPFVAEEKSALFSTHRDWFFMNDGKPWKDGSNWSGFYSLDIDNPMVIAYLEKVFDRVLNEWGYDLVKLDFLYGAAPFGNMAETRGGRMDRAMRLLRKWCGEKPVLGCGVPVMSAFGLVDYCRIGCDVTLDWNDRVHMSIIHRERPSTKNAIDNIISRSQLNGRAYLSDPDVFFLREENLSLSSSRKRDLAMLDALGGGVFLMSDNAAGYDEEKIALYREMRRYAQAKEVHLKQAKDHVEALFVLDGKEQRRRLFFSR